jgi:hypothetical protein
MVTAQLVRYLYVDDGGRVEQEVKAVQVRRTTEQVHLEIGKMLDFLLAGEKMLCEALDVVDSLDDHVHAD